jgi:hypothetical protein
VAGSITLRPQHRRILPHAPLEGGVGGKGRDRKGNRSVHRPSDPRPLHCAHYKPLSHACPFSEHMSNHLSMTTVQAVVARQLCRILNLPYIVGRPVGGNSSNQVTEPDPTGRSPLRHCVYCKMAAADRAGYDAYFPSLFPLPWI